VQFRQKPALDFHVELSPLIDVVFLLLIFFMVSSTFVEEAALEINLPESSSTAESPEEPLEILAKPGGEISFQGQPVAIENLEDAIREALKEDPGKPVILKGDEKLPLGMAVQIMDAVQGSGAEGFTLDAQPKKSGGPASP
jgi:biopolymer transport protein ExbD